jgi:hypothetical protein
MPAQGLGGYKRYGFGRTRTDGLLCVPRFRRGVAAFGLGSGRTARGVVLLDNGEVFRRKPI